MNNEELNQAIETYNKLKDNEIVKECNKAFSKIYEYQDSKLNKPKEEYIDSSKKYHYFLELPYEKLTIVDNGKYGFKFCGYNVIGKKDKNSKFYNLNCCLPYCNISKEEALQIIENRIKEDNLEECVEDE